MFYVLGGPLTVGYIIRDEGTGWRQSRVGKEEGDDRRDSWTGETRDLGSKVTSN